MIVPYFGELLVSPIPLELSFNWCSHGCSFCFANHNTPDRTFNAKSTMNLLKDFRNRNTLEARLLQEGYPILVSNKVDPFAHSNYQQSVPIMRTMTELGIPLAIQTRGGRGVEEVLSFLPPSVWYVSINTSTEELMKQLEPGAPSLESRFRLMETLKEKGHRVVLGLNPLVPEWIPDPTPTLQRAKQCGVEGIWVELLHFNYKQVGVMSAREKRVIGETILARSQTRILPLALQTAFLEARKKAEDLGLSIFSIGQGNASEFFAPYQECYSSCFPTLQDFVNICHATPEKQEWTFTDFWRVIGEERFPQGVFPLGHYVGATAHQVMRTHKIPSRMTYEQLVKLVWQDPRLKFCPVHSPAFAYLAERDEADINEWVELLDENDMRILVFKAEGMLDYYAEI